MTFLLVDRVRESCISPGTATVALIGAALGYQTFSAGIGANNTTYYVIADQSGANWEVGYGTVGALGTTLARTTVLSSSNGGSLVNFTSGTQDVWVDYPATKAVFQDSTGTVSVPVLLTTSTTSTTPNLSFNASNTGFSAGASISGSYLQSVLQNKSGTAGASTNYVLSNDLGTDSTYYGEFGMNSSVFSASTPSDFFSINNGIYFSGHDGDISIGSGNGFKTYLAWGTTGQSAHVINASGALGFSTNLGTTPALSGTTGFGTSGQALVSAGNAAAPAWGTLGASGGGTGQTTLPSALTALQGFTTTATSAGNTLLTNASTFNQAFTGTTTQTITLPVTSTIAQGWSFNILNNSTGILTINSSGGNIVGYVSAGCLAKVVCILTTGTTAASWDYFYDGFSTATGSGAAVLQNNPTINTPTIGGNGLIPAIWTSTTRPSSPTSGQQGYNSTILSMEYWDGIAWIPFYNSPTYSATYLIAAGAGGGGASFSSGGDGGGGGAGGYLTGTTNLSQATVYSFVVGSGGAGGVYNGSVGQSGAAGNNSTAFGLTAIGGGRGGGVDVNGTGGTLNGGSGGGGGTYGGGGTTGGSGTAGQGNNGGGGGTSPPSGGGGGAGSAGSSGSGGSGASNSITGSAVTYCAGGGTGGGTSGGANTGNGGFGNTSGSGGAGGSGVVILSIPTSRYSGITTGSPNVTTSGSNTILTFTVSGSYTA